MKKAEVIKKLFKTCNETYFLNGKRIKKNKLLATIQNNIPDSANFQIKESTRHLNRHTGDRDYFLNAYGKTKFLYKHRFYVSWS